MSITKLLGESKNNLIRRVYQKILDEFVNALIKQV